MALKPDEEEGKEFWWTRRDKKTAKGVKFDEYFANKKKPIKDGEKIVPGNKYEIKYLSADENESITIPRGAVILGAYFGDPKNLSRGKDVTRSVVKYVREKNRMTVFASVEFFGDPWYGSRKQLQVKLALAVGSRAQATVTREESAKIKSAKKFDEYFESVGEKMVGEGSKMNRGLSYDEYYLTADEDETLTIPKEALILAAYFGDPKDFVRGKDVTKEVIKFVRGKNALTIAASVEWFGDPWFGSRKQLQVKVAMIEEATIELTVERGSNGKWGFSYDNELHLRKVNAWASVFGLRPGLKIVAVNRKPVATDSDLIRAVSGKSSVLMKVQGPNSLIAEADAAAHRHAESERREEEEAEARAAAVREQKEAERKRKAVEAERERLRRERAKEAERIRQEEAKSGCKDVAALLRSIGMENRVALFAKEHIDFSALKDLNEDDFRELGLRIGERKRLARKIAGFTRADSVLGPLAGRAARVAAERAGRRTEGDAGVRAPPMMDGGTIMFGRNVASSNVRTIVKTVTFNRAFKSAPSAVAFISEIDSETGRNVRIHVDVANVTKRTCVIKCESWSDSLTHKVTVTWIAAEKSPLVKLGYTYLGSYPKAPVTPASPRSQNVRFEGRPFPSGKPNVMIAFSHLDLDTATRKNIRLSGVAGNVSNASFVAQAVTWGDSLVWRVGIAYVAFDQSLGKGQFSVGPGPQHSGWSTRTTLAMKSATRVYTGSDVSPRFPFVAVGINSLDAQHGAPLHVRCGTQMMGPGKFQATASSWGATKIWSIGTQWCRFPCARSS